MADQFEMDLRQINAEYKLWWPSSCRLICYLTANLESCLIKRIMEDKAVAAKFSD